MSLLISGIEEKYSNSKVLFELNAGSAEIFVIETNPDNDYFNQFILVWGDYVANVWEEKFDLLSTALARMAALVHVLEREEHGDTIGLQEITKWENAWNAFVNNNTDLIEKGN